MGRPAVGYLAWKDEYSIGDDLADEQHRKLIETINQIESDVPLDQILRTLSRYAEEHFSHEERLMAESGFPDLAQHRLQHKAFKAWLEYVVTAQGNGAGDRPAPTRRDIQAYLRVWLANHMLVYDQAIKAWREKSGPGVASKQPS